MSIIKGLGGISRIGFIGDEGEIAGDIESETGEGSLLLPFFLTELFLVDVLDSRSLGRRYPCGSGLDAGRDSAAG